MCSSSKLRAVALNERKIQVLAVKLVQDDLEITESLNEVLKFEMVCRGVETGEFGGVI